MAAVQIARLKKCRTVSLREGFRVDTLTGEVRPITASVAAASMPRRTRPIDSGNDLAIAILKVLGIDSKHTVGVSIDMTVDAPGTVTVKRVIPCGPMQGVMDTIEQYDVDVREKPQLSPPAFLAASKA